MRNGQFKPGYNVQIGTENQFILGYSVPPPLTEIVLLNPYTEKDAPGISSPFWIFAAKRQKAN